MQLSDFDYNLPRDLIAQQPMKPRDHSRLLLLDKKTGRVEHKYFYDIVNYLEKGDVLVFNNSKVFPARLIGRKNKTGGKVEIFLLRKIKGSTWKCLVGGAHGNSSLGINFDRGLIGKILKSNQDGTWQVQFNKSGNDFMKIIERIGLTPLPPYIKRKVNSRLHANDKVDYQTVYADARKQGSVAAPTAGFHFTKGLLNKLKKKGVQLEFVTLHVGLGTFAPVKVSDIKKHKMHAEFVEIKKEVAKRIITAKQEKRRIIAVGTTAVRTLEGVLGQELKKPIKKLANYQFPITTFIYPGYKFKLADALITNFHLPKSTLLMLVSALAGKKNIDRAYKSAVKEKYRFFSYGDAMFIR